MEYIILPAIRATIALSSAEWEHWLGALGTVLLVGMGYLFLRFCRRISQWRKAGLFERSKIATDAPKSPGLHKMSPNRKD